MAKLVPSSQPEIVSGRTLFTLGGVPWKLTSKSPRYLPTRLAAGLVVAFVFLSYETLEARLLYGVMFGCLIVLVNFVHIVGHTLGGKTVGAPMDEALVLDTKIWTRYIDDPPDLPRRIHLGRALGGPLMSIAVGAISLGVWTSIGGTPLLFFAIVNLLLGLGVLFPFPSVDGEVIWRELFRR